MAAKSSTALWKETTAISKEIVKYGQITHVVSGWVCDHCKQEVWNKDASRLAFHLAGDVNLRDANNGFTGIGVCPQVPPDVADRAKIEMAAKAAKRARKSSLSAASQVMPSNGGASSAEGMQESSQHVSNRDAKRMKADASLLNLLASRAVSHKIAYETLLWNATKDIVAAGPGYKLPRSCSLFPSNKSAKSMLVESTPAENALASRNLSGNIALKSRRQEILELWKACLSETLLTGIPAEWRQ